MAHSYFQKIKSIRRQRGLCRCSNCEAVGVWECICSRCGGHVYRGFPAEQKLQARAACGPAHWSLARRRRHPEVHIARISLGEFPYSNEYIVRVHVHCTRMQTYDYIAVKGADGINHVELHVRWKDILEEWPSSSSSTNAEVSTSTHC